MVELDTPGKATLRNQAKLRCDELIELGITVSGEPTGSISTDVPLLERAALCRCESAFLEKSGAV